MASKNKIVVTAEPGKQEVFVTREFDAPRDLVFKAHTDPKLYAQWLGPRGYEMVLETFEPISNSYVVNFELPGHFPQRGFEVRGERSADLVGEESPEYSYIKLVQVIHVFMFA